MDSSSFVCPIVINSEVFDSLHIQLYTTVSSILSDQFIREYKVVCSKIEIPSDLIYLYYKNENNLLEITKKNEKRYMKGVNDENLLKNISKFALSFNYFKKTPNNILKDQGLLNTIQSKLDLLNITK